MSTQGTIKRYLLIFEKLERGRFPSFRDIRSFLGEKGFELSDRTISRDIDQMRNEFRIDIRYDSEKNGYYLDKEDSPGLDDFIRLLVMLTTAGMITDMLKEGKEALKCIAFEGSAQLKGIQHLDKILRAIREHHQIKFSHQGFSSARAREVTLKPYLLKEYQQRWYVVGLGTRANSFTIYGIDRIRSLEISDETFAPNPEADPARLFEDTIGLNYSDHEPEEIIISFTPEQGKYIRTLPLHSSQRIIVDNNTELRIKLYLRVNYELRQKLLSFGDQVKVIGPEWLKQEMVAIYRKALQQY